MALIKCPECGREVSDKAAACPHCGYPLAAMTKMPISEKTAACAAAPSPDNSGESESMTTWDVTSTDVAVSCKQCGRVFKFSRRYFSKISPDGVIPSALLQCPACGNQSAAGLKLPYKSAIKYSCDQPKTSSQLKCPGCGSTNITMVKKGFSVGKAAAGGLLLGPVGVLGGAIGSNKIERVCMKCKRKF